MENTKNRFDIQAYDLKSKEWVYIRKGMNVTQDAERLKDSPRRKIWANGSYNMVSVRDTYKAFELGLKVEDCTHKAEVDNNIHTWLIQNPELAKNILNNLPK
jgi:hypothetical protein